MKRFLDEAAENLSPGYFSLVTATGIIVYRTSQELGAETGSGRVITQPYGWRRRLPLNARFRSASLLQ
jgi:hypothetical protein